MSAEQDLLSLVNGFRISQAIHVAAVLQVSDHLAAGPRDIGWLAERTSSHRESLYRLLRALATVGVYEELPDHVFRSTAVGETLRSNVPDSMAPWAHHIGNPAHRAAWDALIVSVRTGENAFETVHGMSVWEHRAGRPEENAIFDAAMTSIAQWVGRDVLDAYDFGEHGVVVDIGGGRGALLASILARNPAQRGILADQEHVVSGAAEVLTRYGVAERCDIAAIDFFDSVPSGGDAYLLKSVLHDWADTEAIAILRTVRNAMSPSAKVLVVERLIDEPNHGPAVAFSDLNMLVSPGGQERTEAEFDALFETADLRRTGTVRTPSGFALLEAVVDSGAEPPTP
jgi:hypothetical protein